jgi:hypothetical protein
MAPIDQAYTKMLNDIVLLIVGGIGGIVGKRAIGAAANAVTGGSQPTPPSPTPVSPMPPAPAPQSAPSVMPNFNWMGYKNPELDESWTPGPPPTTPPEHMEDDDERAVLAAARNETKA